MSENPFESPQTSGDEKSPAPPAVYVPLQSRAIWAMAGCALLLLFGVVQIGLCLAYKPPADSRAVFSAATVQQVLTPPIVFLPFTVAIYFQLIALMVFFYRAHKNLPALATEGHSFSPGWGIVTFFIPLVSFIGPPLYVREIWRASNPSTPIDEPTAWKHQTTDAIVFWWMAFIVLGALAGFYNGYRMATVHSRETMMDVLNFSLVLNIVAFVGQGVQIAIVGAITRRQQKRFDAISRPAAING